MTILDILLIILWLVALACTIKFSTAIWIAILIISSIYLIIRGWLFLGFDVDDLF